MPPTPGQVSKIQITASLHEEDAMSERRLFAEPIPEDRDREAYIAGLARLLMDDGGLESVRWLVLRPIFESLTKPEQDLVFHWCDIWCTQDGPEKHRLDYRL